MRTLSRRSFLASAAVCSFASALGEPSPESVQIVSERSDPAAPPETIEFNPQVVKTLTSRLTRAEIADRQPTFPAELIKTAQSYVGRDRYHDEQLVTSMLALFEVPFRKPSGEYNAFCACGVAYCAAQTYARLAQRMDSLERFRGLLPDIDYWNYFPSPSCLSMSLVARGKGRWVEAGHNPHPGWIVIYDFSGSGKDYVADHCGIVVSAKNRKIETIEFNTSGTLNGSRINGGFIANPTRPYDAYVKGFVVTNTRNAAS